jgi:predicted acetyltransferase
MQNLLAKGRERGQIVSALMPFRGSFYEHFGFGNAERRTEWTIPTSILPRGDFSGIRFVDPEKDLTKLVGLRHREFSTQHGDVASDINSMNYWISQVWSVGMAVADDQGDRLASYCFFSEERDDKVATVVSDDWSCESPDAFKRILFWMASLKDQYSFIRITTPGDWPINRLLKESQIPHRQVDHPHASARPFTRMQIRILDHVRALDNMQLHSTLVGEVVVHVKECEGTVSKLKLTFGDRHVVARPTADDADVVLSDSNWASLVAGQVVARDAIAWGLIEAKNPQKAMLLNAFGAGPSPWCQEYF